MKTLKEWKEYASKDLVEELEAMTTEEIKEAFNEELSFGTAGIRGIIGPGPNRMNKYTIIKTTYGYAKYLLETFPNQEIKVVIGTDSRHKKEEFSSIAAGVLSSFGIQVFKKTIIPTPMVSFAIKDLKAQGGIIITASHNPPNYNGYKVYNQYGSQLLPESSNKITKYANSLDNVLTYSYKEDKKLIFDIPKKVFQNYKNKVLKMNDNLDKNLTIIFSPQHGTSAKYIPDYLKTLGYKVVEVKEQMNPDPNFSNTFSPNPEDPKAYELGIKYLKENNGDIFITTDPDADRIGVMAKKGDSFEILNGNELAPIIFEYIIKNNKLDNPYLVYSYVSTRLCKVMAQKNNIKTYEVATGFKWIGKLINELNDQNYIFGFEESYGSLIDPNLSMDKDSLQAAVVVAKIANECKKRGHTLWNALENIYKKYGYFKTDTTTKTFEGLSATKDREEFMKKIRKNISSMIDEEFKVTDLIDGKNYIAPMNLVNIEFSDGSWISIRPSGTEPKIKFYRLAKGLSNNEVLKRSNKLDEYLEIIKRAVF